MIGLYKLPLGASFAVEAVHEIGSCSYLLLSDVQDSGGCLDAVSAAITVLEVRLGYRESCHFMLSSLVIKLCSAH